MEESQELSLYASGSLEERFITKILEREDVGHLRWTPAGIYEQLRNEHPELYPSPAPRGLLESFQGPEFLERVANRRVHRRLSQLPAHMLADTVGRRLLDLAFPKLVEQLESGEAFDKRELRMIVKDALAFLTTHEVPGSNGKAKAQESTGLTLQEAHDLLARAEPERKEIIAKALANAFMASVMGEVVDVEATEDV